MAANHDVSRCRQTVFEVNHANISLDLRKPQSRFRNYLLAIDSVDEFLGGRSWPRIVRAPS